ncbi:MAG TPA: glycolate oxidase subunit GlcE [Rudaea sp.]|nr:glycolate oxidase subunit GlcE [Rudaea sp.]
MDAALSELRERIVAANGTKTPLRLRGAGTKDFYGETLAGEILDTRRYRGIVDYEPSELVITARCGTPLSEIERALAERDQCLACEPPRFAGDPTLGGVVAAGLSGPRRATAGAVRDFALGATLVSASGELLRFGGRVMKNVAGFDVSRLLCGSLGILGLIAEVSLKVLPRPRAQTTLVFELDLPTAIERFNRWSAQPLPVSATAWHEGAAYLRLSGARSALAAAREVVGGESMAQDAADAWWSALRDQTHAFFGGGRRLWRLSLPSTAPHVDAAFAGPVLVEWAGALRWVASDESAERIRAAVSALGGTAAQWRGARASTMFHPLADAALTLHRRLKREFDPRGIFNPGRLVAGL